MMTARPSVSALRSMPGPLVPVTAELARERGAQRHVGGGDLVLGLQRDDAEVLVPAELVEQFGRRGDGVAGVEQRQPAALRGRHQAPRQGRRAGDVAVRAGLGGRRLHHVGLREQLGGLAEVVARLERRDVRVVDLLLAAELALEPVEGGLGGPVEHPRHQAEGEHVLRALGLLLADPDVLGGPHRHRGHGHLEDLIAVERPVRHRVHRVAGLLQVALRERVLVEDQRCRPSPPSPGPPSAPRGSWRPGRRRDRRGW